VIGIELLSHSLLPAIVELAEDKQWRVRLAIIENIPLLAHQLGLKMFDEQLSNLCMSWLGDCVYSIREAAVHNLRELVVVFGSDWAKASILPKIINMSSQGNYLMRMTSIFALKVSPNQIPSDLTQQTLSEAVDPAVTKQVIVPTLIKLSSDRVPNIRFNVAKSFEGMRHDEVKACLKKMATDADVDVRYYSEKSLLTV
jgi:serine/threonine-protein phosphatase 2A regulatory subunit A